jgi:hypothetical protein
MATLLSPSRILQNQYICVGEGSNVSGLSFFAVIYPFKAQW